MMPWSRILAIAVVAIAPVCAGLCLLLCGGADPVAGPPPSVTPGPLDEQSAGPPAIDQHSAPLPEATAGGAAPPLPPAVADPPSPSPPPAPTQPAPAPAEEQTSEASGEPAPPEPILYAPTRGGIDAAVRVGLDSLRSCYQAWLGDDPDLGGRILVSFTIQPQEDNPEMARVAELGVYDSEFQHLPLEACTLSVFEEMLFEAPQDGGGLEVRYPIVLNTDEQASQEQDPR